MKENSVREHNRRGLLILERISIFDEEGVLSMMPPKARRRSTRLRKKFKAAQKRQSASRENAT